MVFKYFSSNERNLRQYRNSVVKINALADDMKQLQDDEFPKKTEDFRNRLKNGESLQDILSEAFALVREAADRVIGERHYDVQLIGGMALNDGNIAEMQTGEGKTLSSTCPVYLNALSGQGVHVVTPNDYLAKRDSQWMGQIYQFLGLSVGLIQHDMRDDERHFAYAQDITYGTNNEFGFDYLRDNMKFSLEECVQRGYNFAVIDEVDSILIDEARTPLIISGPTDDNVEKYHTINQVIRRIKLFRELRKEELARLPNPEDYDIVEDWNHFEEHEVVCEGDYTLDEKGKSISLTERGSIKIESHLKGLLKEQTSLFDYENIEVLHHINQALKAHHIFKKDIDYVVQDNKVMIVDEFTGRLMPGRRFSDGLHQALEAKEGVTIERENQTLASVTFQNYFRLYNKLGGMTGTALTEKEEFQKIYNLGVVSIPTNRPIARIDRSDVIYKNSNAKFKAIGELVKTLHEKQQPVLVGTVSIEVSEKISQILHQNGVPHEVLNAKHHEREAEIIANAGKTGSVTIATNMAGRGTDIKLDEASRKAGGLFVLGTERHDSRRIDNQLRGRSGRQGDPGASQFFLALDDGLLRIFGGEWIARMMDRLKIEDDEPIEHSYVSRAIKNAQKKVEGHHFGIRKHLLEYDDVMNRQRSIIYQRRRSFMTEDPKPLLLEAIDETFVEHFEMHCGGKYADQWDISGFRKSYLQIFKRLHHEKWYEEDISKEEMMQKFFDHLGVEYQEQIDEFTKVFNQELPPEQAPNALTDLQRHILISTADSLWKDHLLAMDHVREETGLVGYAQKKPIVEYKKRAFELFSNLIMRINIETTTTFFKVKLSAVPTHEPQPPQDMVMSHDEVGEFEQKTSSIPKQKPAQRSQTIKRNDPCPCGSGKKFKKCHGK